MFNVWSSYLLCKIIAVSYILLLAPALLLFQSMCPDAKYGFSVNPAKNTSSRNKFLGFIFICWSGAPLMLAFLYKAGLVDTALQTTLTFKAVVLFLFAAPVFYFYWCFWRTVTAATSSVRGRQTTSKGYSQLLCLIMSYTVLLLALNPHFLLLLSEL